ncbi:glycosyltransferase family 2 protein [Streptococcus symci]|uniref:glycosyltransferase family 2 protein n=1 Tax=Streptococcus symci TaxID=2588991 RepID=UPI001FE270DA|nr:glycosyltransferase [Streptococcus symci]
MESLISVIIPVYNTENYIGVCLESLVKQTYTNFEVLMIDDGSTDNSGRICQEYTEN